MESTRRPMPQSKFVLCLSAVFVFAGLTSGQTCHVPAVCDGEVFTETTWIDVDPFMTCQLEEEKDRQRNNGNNSAMTTLRKDIDQLKTETDTMNTTVQDQQETIRSLNEILESLKNENKEVTSELQNLTSESAKLRSEITELNETYQKKLSALNATLHDLEQVTNNNTKHVDILKDVAKTTEWKLNCRGEECTGNIVFESTNELRRELSDLISTKISRSFSHVETMQEKISASLYTASPSLEESISFASESAKSDVTPNHDVITNPVMTAASNEELEEKFSDLISMKLSKNAFEVTTKQEEDSAPFHTVSPSLEESTSFASTLAKSDVTPKPNVITNPVMTTASNEGCRRSSFTFTNDVQTSDYIKYKGTLPHLTEFSICAWLSPAGGHSAVKGSLFSYCVMKGSSGCNSLLIFFPNTEKLQITTHHTRHNFAEKSIDPIESRSHFCVTASSDLNNVRLFINGVESGLQNSFLNWKLDIPTGGLLIVGHEQDTPPSGSQSRPYFVESNQAFVGKIENLNLWERILNKTEIQNMNRATCSCPDDAIVTLNETMVDVKGDVAASFNGTCN